MRPSASVLLPTRGRRAYLGVALRQRGRPGPRAGRRARRRRGRPRGPRDGGARRRRGWALRRAGARPAGSTSARNAAVAAPRGPTCCASSTTTSRPGRAGSAALLAGAARTPATRSSAVRSAPRLEGARPPRVRARARARHRAGPRHRRTATPSSCGARTSRCAARRSSASAASTPTRPLPGTRRTSSAGCGPRAAGCATSPPRASTTAGRAPTPASRASAGGLPPGPRLPPLRRAQGTAPPIPGELRDARRLRRPHRPPPLRQRHRPERPHGGPRSARRSPHAAAVARERPRLPVGRVGHAQPAPAGSPRAARDLARRRPRARRSAPAPRAARSAPPRAGCSLLGVARPEHAATTARRGAELERSRHDVAVRLAEPGRPGPASGRT